MKAEPIGEMPRKVLDANAFIAFLQREPRGAAVKDLLIQAADGKVQLLMSVINLGEVYCITTRAKNKQVADQVIDEIYLSSSITIVEADWRLTLLAAQFKAAGALSYADCFAASLAQNYDCPVVTGDPEFHRLEDQIQVEWI